MAKPNNLPEWDTNELNIDLPTSAQTDDGWQVTLGVPEKPSYKLFNWFMNLVYKWIDYFNESTIKNLDTLADLASYEGVTGETVYIKGRASENDGGQGVWVLTAGNFTTELAADTQNGVYLEYSGEDGSTRAWVRQHVTNRYFLGWFGAYDDGTNASLNSTILKSAIDVVGDGVLELAPRGVYRVLANSTALETHWNNLSSGYITHVAVELETGNSGLTIEGNGATIQILSTNNASEISYIFGNSKDETITDIAYRDVVFDLDHASNPTAEQERAVLSVSIENLIFDRCRFTSSSTKGGYALDSWDCENVAINHCKFDNISGGINSIYCRNITVTSPVFYGMNECIDSDKYDQNYTITNPVMYGGDTPAGQAIDVNAAVNFSVSGGSIKNFGSGTLAIIGKLLSDDFATHAAGGAASWKPGENISFNGVAFENCGNSATSVFLSMSSDWSTDTGRSGTGSTGEPTSNVNFTGCILKDCGQWYIREGRAIKISCLFDGSIVPTTSADAFTIFAFSENDFTTYPDAQTYSDLQIDLSESIARNLDGGFANLRYASIAKVDNVTVENTSLVTSVDTIRFRDVDIRDCAGSACNNTLKSVYGGLNLHTNTDAGSAIIKIRGNHIDSTSSAVNMVGTEIEKVVIGEQIDVRVGDVTAASMDISEHLATMRSNSYLYNVRCTARTDVTQSDTNYVAFNIRNRSEDGSTASAIIAPTTQITGGVDINALANTDLTGLITDSDAFLAKENSVDCFFEATGSGQDLSGFSFGLRIIEY